MLLLGVFLLVLGPAAVEALFALLHPPLGGVGLYVECVRLFSCVRIFFEVVVEALLGDHAQGGAEQEGAVGCAEHFDNGYYWGVRF